MGDLGIIRPIQQFLRIVKADVNIVDSNNKAKLRMTVPGIVRSCKSEEMDVSHQVYILPHLAHLPECRYDQLWS